MTMSYTRVTTLLPANGSQHCHPQRESASVKKQLNHSSQHSVFRLYSSIRIFRSGRPPTWSAPSFSVSFFVYFSLQMEYRNRHQLTLCVFPPRTGKAMSDQCKYGSCASSVNMLAGRILPPKPEFSSLQHSPNGPAPKGKAEFLCLFFCVIFPFPHWTKPGRDGLECNPLKTHRTKTPQKSNAIETVRPPSPGSSRRASCADCFLLLTVRLS